MTDDLVIGARWSQKNAVGMTIDADEVEAICAMADRIEELEARLANASVALKQALDSLSFAAHELAAQAHIPEEDSEMLRDRISCVVTTIAKIKGKQP